MGYGYKGVVRGDTHVRIFKTLIFLSKTLERTKIELINFVCVSLSMKNFLESFTTIFRKF